MLAAVPGATLPAQQAVRQPGQRDPTVTASRPCERHTVEGVAATFSTSDSVTALDTALAQRIADEVAFRFEPPRSKTPRRARLEVVLRRNGSISELRFLKRSGLERFDREAQYAVESAAAERAFGRLPVSHQGGPLPVVVLFGEQPTGGSPYVVTHNDCPAWPAPGNPHPGYPEDLRRAEVAGRVRARFVVDTDGRVELGTFQVLESNHAAFTTAVARVLPQLRYLPAELRGRKIPQVTEQEFSFGFAVRPAGQIDLRTKP